MGNSFEKHRGNVVFVDQLLWQDLATAQDAPRFCAAFLTLQCAVIKDVSRAVVVLGAAGDGPYERVATWPGNDSNEITPSLAALAEQCLADKKPRVSTDPAGFCAAYPIRTELGLHGVVAAEWDQPPVDTTRVVRELQWGAAWMELYLRRTQAGDRDVINERLLLLANTVAVASREQDFTGAARALATELGSRLMCDRVSVGWRQLLSTRLLAISHSSQIDRRLAWIADIEAAMDEACDQGRSITIPDDATAGECITGAHERLAANTTSGYVQTYPLDCLTSEGGAITYERGKRFTRDERSMLESLAPVLGGLLEARRLADRSLTQRFTDRLKNIGAGFGNRPVQKTVLAGAVLIVSLLAFVPGTYRVTADARVEGAVQRSMAVPADGFIESSAVKAGDQVRKDDLLFALDDRDLRLEKLRLASERAQLAAQAQDALANRERAQLQVINAQVKQRDAQLSLVEQQIERSLVRAPFDGIVISGDLSQRLGTPVRRGDVLFEVAPLADYRLIIKVDEHDLADIEAGQHGRVVLSALPYDPIAFEVDSVTPVATAEEGLNFFRVEALMTGDTDQLRPGMEGVAKIDTDEQSILRNWTKRVSQRLRLLLWSIWP